ncbi:AraC family transcriptional regulator [Amycolatopsis sp. YIM 10]|uniref:AraC family transcriptional regulator n=1 Tax=Amycolatopsis sp. YIM 10 TaxID=2653857 RepID=UPI00128FDB0E|nr:AraC family transcriptional regulator [Amycolatopsis sp. YIM 10]QFU88639.1 Multiple antibiotic resistance protein MarA [Amycolatopsis sp. YIM 10]
MDILSDVLAVVRAGRPRSALVGWRAPWAQRFPPVPGAVGFRVVLRGECVLIPADGVPVRLGTGDVVLLPHGGPHVLADAPETVPAAEVCDPDAPDFVEPAPADAGTLTLCGAYELAPAGGHPLLRDLPEVVHLGGGPELRSTVDLLAGELLRPGLGTGGVVPALLDLVLLYALRTWFAERRPGWGAALRDPVVNRALEAIHAEPARPWTVATLAERGGLSRAPFARRFTELTGRSPGRYLTWWRMTTAARLLRESDAPLAVVAAAVGYRSEFAFATAFKRQYATAPGRYRRHAAGLPPEPVV